MRGDYYDFRYECVESVLENANTDYVSNLIFLIYIYTLLDTDVSKDFGKFLIRVATL